MEHNFNKRYIGRFLAISIPAWFVMAFLPLPPIFNVVMLAVVAYFVGRRFAKDNVRSPVASEQNRFSGISFVAIVAVMATLAFLSYMVLPPADQAAMIAPFQEKSWSVKIFGTLIAALMVWGCISSGFAIGARLYMKKLSKGV